MTEQEIYQRQKDEEERRKQQELERIKKEYENNQKSLENEANAKKAEHELARQNEEKAFAAKAQAAYLQKLLNQKNVGQEMAAQGLGGDGVTEAMLNKAESGYQSDYHKNKQEFDTKAANIKASVDALEKQLEQKKSLNESARDIAQGRTEAEFERTISDLQANIEMAKANEERRAAELESQQNTITLKKGTWYIRSQPSMNSHANGVVRGGQRIHILGVLPNGWYKVEGGYIGPKAVQ